MNLTFDCLFYGFITLCMSFINDGSYPRQHRRSEAIVSRWHVQVSTIGGSERKSERISGVKRLKVNHDVV